jgi:RHS repeat-associated protein
MPYGRLKKYCREQNGDVATQVKDTTKATANANEKFRFYYHTDHLGSSSNITDISGEVYQHMEYFPFGETFIEERTDAEYTSYLFNGKELDEETGLYYYGARYYDPRISIWYGVDPLVDKNISKSPYCFVSNNPLKRVDPDGKDDFELDSKGYIINHIETKGKDNVFIVDGQEKR